MRRAAPRSGRDRRHRARADEGFVLLESIIAIALITVLMVALTALFVNAMQTTAHQRATQGAVRIATDEIDQARGLGATAALAGRDRASVQQQFAEAPDSFRGWLSTAAVQAFSAGATAGTGVTPCAEGAASDACAALPTTAVVRTVNSTDYAVHYYQQWCHLSPDDGAMEAAAEGDTDRAADGAPGGDDDPAGDPGVDGTPDCADPAVATDARLRQFLRVVVAIGWTDSTCPAGGCSYVTSVMLSVDADPMFYFRTPPPPPPKITGCDPTSLSSTVGDHLDRDIVGTDGFCGFTDGVPPITWGGTGLPDGLALLTAGGITGTLSRGGDFTVTLTATDAFLRTASTTFDWPVTYRPLAAPGPGPQVSTVGADAAPVALTATGGSGDCVFTDPTGSLPPGVSVAGNEITGAPAAAGRFPVTLTATDAEADMTTTVDFTWTVNPPPAVSPPPNTTTAPGGQVVGRAVGSAGTPPYTFALQNAPDWLHIDPNSGELSGIADDQIADYPGILVTLTDSRGATATSAPLNWSVYQVPTLVPPGDQTADLGAAVSLQVQADCTVPPCTYSAEGLPSWLNFDAGTGLLHGTAPSTGGLFTGITVAITDGRETTVSSEFSWVVGPQQTISTPDDQVWTVGRALQSATANGLQIAADCSADPCTFGLAPGSGSLPTGLNLDTSTGLITGTPAETGEWTSIIVSVTNAAGVPATAEPITWTINPAPTLTPPGNQRTVAGDPVSLALAHSCPSTPCSFTSTTLPDGLALDDGGQVSGIVSTGGVSMVTVTVTDNAGATASQTFTWYVLAFSGLPDIQVAQQGQSGKCRGGVLTQTLTNYVAGYSPDIAFSADRTDLVTIDGSEMTVTASCQDSVSAEVTVTARDSGGSAPEVTVSTTFVLDIRS